MKRAAILFAILGLMLTPAALAQGKDQGRDRGGDLTEWQAGPFGQRQGQGWGNQFSPGEAREAVREGKTVSLNKIFQSLKREYGGYQLKAELYARENGGAYYEIDWMSDSGRKMRFVVDASTGTVLERQGA